jgi:hypothetical protein
MTGEEIEHPVFGRERNWVYACDDLLDQYRKTKADWTLDKAVRLRRAINESVRAYARDIETARFLDMSQTFSLKVPLLRKIFPDARFIVQTRNPYATCMKEACDDAYEWRRKTELKRKLEIFAEHWRNTYACAVGDLKEHEHKITVRYEDFVEDPEHELRRIAEAVDLAYDPDMVPRAHHRLPFGSSESHKWYPVRTGANEKYLNRLSARTASVIQENVGDMARSFGYQSPA